MKKSLLIDLLLVFMKIGLFTFGGGYAMIAMIENICVEKKHWLTHDELANITVIAESTPGPIAINCATFVGFRQAGFLGAVLTTFGIVFPSFLILFIISMYLKNFLDIALIAAAFKGIKAAVGLLIIDAAVTMAKKMPRKLFPRLIMIASFSAMTLVNLFSLRLTSINLLLTAGLISLLFFFYQRRTNEKDGVSQ